MPWGDCTGPWWAQSGTPPRRRGFWGWLGGWFGRGPWWAQNYSEPYSEEEEKTWLKNEASWLRSRLEAIRQRLRDLGEDID